MDFDKSDIAQISEALYATLLLTVAAEPDILNTFIEKDPRQHNNWEKLRLDLSTDQAREDFAQKIDKWIKTLDWSHAESVMQQWGKYGWVLMPDVIPVRKWEICPHSQEEADEYMLNHFDSIGIQELINTITAESNQNSVVDEAVKCFENECFTACASLLLSLIDGTLISSFVNEQFENKKTGKVAGQRIIDETDKNIYFFIPGIFGLQSKNFQTYMAQLFERANNFTDEPKCLNRNYVHHGMSKRQITNVDCIKLFLAYLQAIRFTQYTTPAR